MSVAAPDLKIWRGKETALSTVFHLTDCAKCSELGGPGGMLPQKKIVFLDLGLILEPSEITPMPKSVPSNLARIYHRCMSTKDV